MAGPEIMHITYGVFRSFGIPALCIGIWIMLPEWNQPA